MLWLPSVNVIFCTGSEAVAVAGTWPLKYAFCMGDVIVTDRGTFSTSAEMAALAGPVVPALFTACAAKLCGPSARTAVLNDAVKLGGSSVACTALSTRKL